MEKLILEMSKSGRKGYSLPKIDVPKVNINEELPESALRKSDLPLPEISESEVARHFVRLSHMNYNIEEGVYPLGSCTMKYNPKINETAAALPGFAELHPCSEEKHSQGAIKLMYELGEYLKEITGFQGVTLQPAAGSQGEFTGINLIAAYHRANGDNQRDKILTPDSAHGTNPASCAISGFDNVSVKSNDRGLVDVEALKEKCGDDTAAFMLTNPNTLGLFESEILEIQKVVHEAGGLMYMDGANLNALMGITTPAKMGFDCVHLNLHKTFSTPHGGGGPGSGPVCANEKLEPFLPIPRAVKKGDTHELSEDFPQSIGRILAFYGNFSIFVRAYAYIRMLGAEGLRKTSENAVINANYLLSLLRDVYEAPHGEKCMHEFVLSGDRQKEKGANTKDISKRLLDYGFHAPTMYFPLIVHEAMLVEPTETETVENLNDFAETMLKIDKEIEENKELVNNAPYNTPVRRLDDAYAARKLNISWFDQPED